MANELNIPGFKHYELDSTYQAKLAAGEVEAKDLSFVEETGKIHTMGGEYGGKTDSALSDTSTNAIQNKAVTEALGEKQDKVLKFEDVTANNWVSDSTYADYPYRCDMSCTGVTETMYAEVVFGLTESTSGQYAPLCETKEGVVSIWSKENTSITIPTIVITI